MLMHGMFNWDQTNQSNPPVKARQDGTLVFYQLSDSSRRLKSWNGTGVAYAINDDVGGKLTVPTFFNFGETTAWLMSLAVLDLDAQNAPLRILFFDSDPTVATLTDNAPLALGTDAAKVTAYVDILATDYVTLEAGKSLAQIWSLMLPLVSDGTVTTLYFAIVSLGTPNYTNGKGLQLTLGVRES